MDENGALHCLRCALHASNSVLPVHLIDCTLGQTGTGQAYVSARNTCLVQARVSRHAGIVDGSLVVADLCFECLLP